MFLEFHSGRGATGAGLSEDDFYPVKICGLFQSPFLHAIPAAEFPDGQLLGGGAVKDSLNCFETFAAEEVVEHGW